MIATLVLFDNAQLSADADALRERMRERADVYKGIPGLLWKFWLDDPESSEFGALLVWESREALETYRAGQVNQSLDDVWGVAPTIREFHVNQVLEPDGTVSLGNPSAAQRR